MSAGRVPPGAGRGERGKGAWADALLTGCWGHARAHAHTHARAHGEAGEGRSEDGRPLIIGPGHLT